MLNQYILRSSLLAQSALDDASPPEDTLEALAVLGLNYLRAAREQPGLRSSPSLVYVRELLELVQTRASQTALDEVHS